VDIEAAADAVEDFHVPPSLRHAAPKA
jgi:hypothetical protein